MDNLTKEQRRKNMQGNKASGTKPEAALAKTLFPAGTDTGKIIKPYLESLIFPLIK